VLLTFQAFVLGLVQGATEFIPVSSSGHLQAVPYLFGWDPGSLAFDVALHLGTLVAVVVVFRHDLHDMTRALLGRPGLTPLEREEARALALLVIIGTIPAAVVGVLARDAITSAFEQPRTIAAFLVLTAVLLVSSERRRRALGTVEPDAGDVARTSRELAAAPLRTALGVGAAQALAIFPGVSRSGATIAAGLALGLSRGAAARLSFLMLLPITVGAALVTLPGLADPPTGSLPFGTAQIVVGVATSAVSGYVAIRFLLALVARRSLVMFAGYVLVLAAVLVGVSVVRG
jgi:undecaprenyl-diphosphatase